MIDIEFPRANSIMKCLDGLEKMTGFYKSFLSIFLEKFTHSFQSFTKCFSYIIV